MNNCPQLTVYNPQLRIAPKNKRAFLDISFSLIFAFLVGGIIIFGAIYGLGQYTKTEELIRSAESGESLGNIIASFESSSEDARTGNIDFPTETKIISRCENTRGFGAHTFRISEELKNKMSENDIKISFKNKYIFSKEEIVGKNFNLFAKSFNYPYEVATIVYLTSLEDKYCFVDAPRKIENELRNVGGDNIILRNCEDKENRDATKICFNDRGSCDVKIEYSSGIITKGNDKYFFDSDALMYAAIFSDFYNYECGVSRLIARTNTLSKLYQEKSAILKNRCDSNMISDLGSYSVLLEKFSETEDIFQISNMKYAIESRNSGSGCKLW